MEKRRLLIVSCSARKRQVSNPTPAWELYNGVIFRTLKRLKREGMFPEDVDLLILSALYGIITPNELIKSYDLKMTREIAIRLAPKNVTKLRTIMGRNNYQSVFINVGKTYLLALQPLEGWVPPETQVFIAEGKIGQKLNQMKKWLMT